MHPHGKNGLTTGCDTITARLHEGSRRGSGMSSVSGEGLCGADRVRMEVVEKAKEG